MRPELSPLPKYMLDLPLDHRGYPVPAFVEWVDGQPDFRVMSQRHWNRCVEENRCWVCGYPIGSFKCFVSGPMCGISRTSAEPPCHKDCALWSVKNCPFLTRPYMVRREDEFTEKLIQREGMIKRNPGATMILVTKSYRIFHDAKGNPLCEMGEPVEVLWFFEGREATRAEVEKSIEDGMPNLVAASKYNIGGPKALAGEFARFLQYLP